MTYDLYLNKTKNTFNIQCYATLKDHNNLEKYTFQKKRRHALLTAYSLRLSVTYA